MTATDPRFSIDDEHLDGILTTHFEFDGTNQVYNPGTKKYVGRIPTITGYIRGHYENVVGAI
jgi:hypothetical protein